MLTGIKFKAHPTEDQKLVLSQWMGCSRYIWNAKVAENAYYSTFARKFYPVGTFAPIDQKTAQFKNKELSPWLSQCPSQIIRNSAVNWYNTYQSFMKGVCGKPRFKSKSDKGSIHVTSELFKFETCEDGVMRLFVGSKTNNIGHLSFKKHRHFEIPKSLYIRKERGSYYVSFCYENGQDQSSLSSQAQHLEYLSGATDDYLEKYTIGIDRGVAIPACTGNNEFDFTANQKKKMGKSERYIKRFQRRLAKQQKGSNRRNKTKRRIAHCHAKVGNIRHDFCHKTSRSLINSEYKIFVFEDLKTKNMTASPAPKPDGDNGHFLPNKAKAKAGLNKAILNAGWFNLELFTQYKAYAAGKVVFKVSAAHTSQECANCSCIHPDNRQSQSEFFCVACGHSDNADRNAAKVIAKRAITMIKDSTN